MDKWIEAKLLGSGWAAVCMWVNRVEYPGEEFVEPYCTGSLRYRSREQAEHAAKAWASGAGLPFVS